MKRPWLAYLLVSLAACGAGIAITGLPSSGNAELLVLTPVASTTIAPSTSAATTSTTEPTPSTTSRPTTTTVPTTTSTTSTTAPVTTTTEAAPEATTTTTAPTTTTVTTTTTTTTEPPAPTEADIAVANGAGVPGIAGDAAELLTDAGFGDVAAINSVPVDVTTVYYVDGFESVAAAVAETLFIDPGALDEMANVPDLATDQEFDVVAVLGADIGP